MSKSREYEKSSDYYQLDVVEKFKVGESIIKGTIRTTNDWMVDGVNKIHQTYLIELKSTQVSNGNYDYFKRAMQLATEYKQKTDTFNLEHGSK